MSHQQRTWVETVDKTTGQTRWDVLINGAPVPGGYVLKLSDESFEVHYPRIATFTRATLAEAKERVEWAPPITVGQAHIANEVSGDEAGFVSTVQAAEVLGLSIYRVNAMVANGKLAARRGSDGVPEVSKASLDALIEASRPAATV